MRGFVFAICFMVSAPCAAGEEWATTDYALLGSALTLQAVDWAQTRNAMRRNAAAGETRYVERNPIVGPTPSAGRLDKIAALTMLSTAGLAVALPSSYRRWFLGAVVVIEAAVVYGNHQIGLRVDF